jgi:hypothetical protein
MKSVQSLTVVALAGAHGRQLQLFVGPRHGLVFREALRELFDEGQLPRLVRLQIDQIEKLPFG